MLIYYLHSSAITSRPQHSISPIQFGIHQCINWIQLQQPLQDIYNLKMEPSGPQNAQQSQEIVILAQSPALMVQAEISDRIQERDEEEAPIARAPHTRRFSGKELTCIFAVFVVIVLALAKRPPPIIKPPVPTKYVFTEVDGDNTNFEFLVYCPHSYYDEKFSFRGVNGAKPTNRLLYQSYFKTIENQMDAQYNSNSTYLVEATSKIVNYTDKNGTAKSAMALVFCGLVRFFNQTCEDAFIGCSSPGPIFDIPTRSSIDVIWVNSFDPDVMPDPDGTCLSECHDNAFCSLQTKQSRSSQTYQDVTIPSSFMGTPMRVNSTYWPLSVHLHGAEIRPTFDGNPLSWLANNKENITVGPAAFSLEQKCYHDSFDKISGNSTYFPPNITLRDPFTGEVIRNYKINRYPNRQNPGILWYHDHAMHLTTFNVQYGLAGFYILRDPIVEAEIGVAIENQRLVMVTGTNLFISWQGSSFVPNVVYRFRFLNMNFDDGSGTVMRIRFSYNYCNDSVPQLQTFTLIGADSSLFDRSIDNQTNFVLSQAERMDILIKFAPNTSHFSICTEDYLNPDPDTSIKQDDSLLGIKLGTFSGISNNTRTSTQNISLSVAYTDLSLETNIPITRMRPLLFIGFTIFSIHGRSKFHQGWSENPTIGTVQDWYIINTIFFAHPMHIHLINFQVIREFDLRVITTPLKNKCSIYQLDFLIEALKLVTNDSKTLAYKNQILPANATNTINYQILCDHRYPIQNLAAVQEQLASIYPQDTVDANNVSGLDVRMIMTAQDVINLNTSNFTISPTIDFTNLSSYKYVQNEGYPSSKLEYARWKDTANLAPFKVQQFRIRWAKSDFTETDRASGQYFNIPNDQLREYPGFVYHCHILHHEDNEMMRPIMLQLPANAYLNTSTPCNLNSTGQPMLNWSDKFACINQRCGNPS